MPHVRTLNVIKTVDGGTVDPLVWPVPGTITAVTLTLHGLDENDDVMPASGITSNAEYHARGARDDVFRVIADGVDAAGDPIPSSISAASGEEITIDNLVADVLRFNVSGITTESKVQVTIATYAA